MDERGRQRVCGPANLLWAELNLTPLCRLCLCGSCCFAAMLALLNQRDCGGSCCNLNPSRLSYSVLWWFVIFFFGLNLFWNEGTKVVFLYRKTCRWCVCVPVFGRGRGVCVSHIMWMYGSNLMWIRFSVQCWSLWFPIVCHTDWFLVCKNQWIHFLLRLILLAEKISWLKSWKWATSSSRFCDFSFWFVFVFIILLC